MEGSNEDRVHLVQRPLVGYIAYGLIGVSECVGSVCKEMFKSSSCMRIGLKVRAVNFFRVGWLREIRVPPGVVTLLLT